MRHRSNIAIRYQFGTIICCVITMGNSYPHSMPTIGDAISGPRKEITTTNTQRSITILLPSGCQKAISAPSRCHRFHSHIGQTFQTLGPLQSGVCPCYLRGPGINRVSSYQKTGCITIIRNKNHTRRRKIGFTNCNKINSRQSLCQLLTFTPCTS